MSVPRVLALLAFHNEMRYLPGFFRNVPPQVDGILALDDGSTDGSGDFVAGQPGVVELLRKPPAGPHVWDEAGNRKLLLQAAGCHRPDWLIAPYWIIAIDADERLEHGFRARSHAEIARAEAAGIAALSVHFRELWDTPDQYRADGLWGQKRFARFFRHREDAEIDPRALHGHWAPLNSKTGGGYPAGDLYVYHLRMLEAADRRARRERYERLDPENRFQAIGYAYLTDETGLRRERLPAGREVEGLARPAPALACVVLALGNPPELRDAVRSLLAQELETGEPVEILVVNSGGGGAAETLGDLGVPVIEHAERLLPGAARNLGLAAARAPFIAFLAADCQAEPGWAAARLRAHRAGAAAVASAVTNPYRHNLAAWTSYVALFARRMPGAPPDAALRYGASYARRLFERCGTFREDLRGGEDTDFHQRLAAHQIAIAWEPAVRTAHCHPRRLAALFTDQYRRGARSARAWARLAGPSPRQVAVNALRRVPEAISLAWHHAEAGERFWIAAASCLLPLAAAVYAAGALSGQAPSPGEEDEP